MEKELSKKEKLAYEMYDDYCEAVGGKARNGDVLPKSDEFFNDPKKETQALGWIQAAQTAIAFISTDISWDKFANESKRQKDLVDDMALDILTGKKKPSDIPFNTEKTNKKYTEPEMKMALEYQKAECYQVVGNLLIGQEKPKIEEALNYLANDTVHSIAEIDEMLNELD